MSGYLFERKMKPFLYFLTASFYSKESEGGPIK